MFHWFSGRKRPEQASLLPSSGLSRLESTKPYHQARNGNGGNAQPANRKQERLERREVLYAVVREAMVRAGVLSSCYKFKVLSLDPRGRQFLVMVDLAQGANSQTNRLAEIEAMVAQSAKARYDILVAAVYWRLNEHVAIGDPMYPAAHAPVSSRPMPLEPAPPPRAPFDPLQADEVTAFRKALTAGLAAGVRGEQALTAANGDRAPAHLAAPTGFEDTELIEDDLGEHLSGTQYGALR